MRAEQQAAEAGAQVLGALGQAEGGHHLRGGGDVEAGLPRHPLVGPAEADHHVAQRPVVHVDDPPPEHLPRVDAQPVALVEVVVDQRRQQVVGGGDGVEVAGEVEVDVARRHQRGAAAAGGAPLDAEDRAERRLAQRQAGLAAEPGEPLGEADRGGGLPLSGAGGGDRRHQDQPPARPVRVEGREADLALVLAVGDEVLGGDAQVARHFGDGSDAGRSGGGVVMVLLRCAAATP